LGGPKNSGFLWIITEVKRLWKVFGTELGLPNGLFLGQELVRPKKGVALGRRKLFFLGFPFP